MYICLCEVITCYSWQILMKCEFSWQILMKCEFSWQMLMKCEFSWQILMKCEFFWQIFERYFDIKFQENLINGSRYILCGQTDGRVGRQTGRMKLIVDFHNFANMPKNCTYVSFLVTQSFVLKCVCWKTIVK